MKLIKITSVKDDCKFKISTRKSGVWYSIKKKEKDGIIITSIKSKKTFVLPPNAYVWVMDNF